MRSHRTVSDSVSDSVSGTVTVRGGAVEAGPAAAPGRSVHAEAVERAIRFMRQRLGESQDLRELADVAFLSPFHFHRVFRATTGAPPGRFLTALRMATAKNLLLETELSATDVSIAVGYSSFGTFTSQFTRLVGMPPGRFRACTAALAELRVRDILGAVRADRSTGRVLRGRLSARPDGSEGLTLVGLFRSSIPQERPLACTYALAAGPIDMPCGRLTGSGRILAISVRLDAAVHDVLAERPAAGLFVGVHHTPISAHHDGEPEEFSIRLRRASATDPPVLGAFPLLLIGDRDRLGGQPGRGVFESSGPP